MVSLNTQKQFSKVKDLNFCYICGKTFQETDITNDDHVPPRSIFATQDRNFPLKLKTHKQPCHSDLNLDDEAIGQLISLIHGKQPSLENDKLKIDIYKDSATNHLLATYNQKNIEQLIWRWLKGFHAALYLAPLPIETKYTIQSPFPSGVIKEKDLIEEPIKPQHYLFVGTLKRNSLVKNIDYLISNNKKLRYECIWDQLSDNSWACIFGIDLYGWIDLGDVNNFQARACVGMYRLPNGKAPVNSSLATKLTFPIHNKNTTDPFSL